MTGGEEDGGGDGNLAEAPSVDDVASAAAGFRALCCAGECVAAPDELRLSVAVFSLSSRLWDRGVEAESRGLLEERRGGES